MGLRQGTERSRDAVIRTDPFVQGFCASLLGATPAGAGPFGLRVRWLLQL